MGAAVHRIEIRIPDAETWSVELPAEAVLRVGAAKGCELQLAANGVAPLHCFFKATAGKLYLVVKDPAATTLVNGQPASKCLVQPGDVVAVGEAELRYDVAATDPIVGTQVAGYLIEERIGLGGYGTVYRATQLSLNRTVAVKILSPEFTEDRKFVERFLNEAQAAARLNHPNVVQVYDARQEGEYFFFSMEYMPGGTLGDVLKKQGSLDPEIALKAIHEAAQALVWAEEHGIVHRDIKPDNLLIARDGTVKIADLGLAIESYEDGGAKKKWVGSPRYMAPEQALGRPVDHRADIYALGCTFFHALTGHYVFDGANAAELLKKKVSMEPPSLARIAPHIPAPIAGVVDVMIAREPEHRFVSCQAMLDALEDVLYAIESPQPAVAAPVAPPVAASPPKRQRTGGPRRSRRSEAAPARGGMDPAVLRWTAIGIGGVLTVILVLLIVSGGSGDRTAPDPLARGGAAGGVSDTGAERSRPAPTPASADETTETRPRDDATSREPSPSPRADVVTGREPSTDSDDPVLRQLQSILRRHQSGLLTDRDAILRLEAFKQAHTASQYQTAADFHLTRLKDDVAKVNRTTVLAEIQKNFTPLIGAQKYREAREYLDRLLARFPENAEQIAPFEKTIADEARADWDKKIVAIDALAAEGSFGSARTRLNTLAAAYPESFEPLVTERLDRWTEHETVYASVQESSAGLEKEFAAAVARLDFAAAAGVGAKLPPFPEESFGRRVVDMEKQRFAAEAALCETAWKAVQKATLDAARDRRSIELHSSERPEAGTAAYAVESVEGGRMTLRTSGGDTAIRSALAVSDAVLEGLFEASLDASWREGLGLLYLYNQRPQRARPYLEHELLGSLKIERYSQRLAKADAAFLNDTLARLTGDLEKLSARALEARDPAKLVDEWNAFGDDVARFIGIARTSPGFAAIRPAVHAAFLTARSGAMVGDVPQSLFHGRVKSYKAATGEIELEYDFSSKDQLADWEPKIDPQNCKLALVNKTMQVRGEYRLAKGNPFMTEIKVTASVPNRGYNPDSPNINIVLWTADEDSITPTGYRSISSSSGGSSTGTIDDPPSSDPNVLPDDYFVFGLGFRTANTSYLSSTSYYYGYLNLPGINTRCPMPAQMCFSGKRRQPILSYWSTEGIWGEGVVSKVKGKQVVQIVTEPGKVIWAVNGKRAPLHKSRYFDRFDRTEPFRGSVTIFTNGESVHYEGLEIESILDPQWVAGELSRRATEELAKIDPGVPVNLPAPTPPPGGQIRRAR